MIRKSIKEKIKEYFFIFPEKRLRLRQIERELKLSFPSVVRYCKELLEEDILKIYEISGVKFYTSNFNNPKYKLEKKLFNLKSLYESELIEHITNNYDNPPIILFGSYAKGEDLSDSDIDIFIETTQKIKNLQKFEKILKRNIQIFGEKSIKHIKNPHLANNIINGIKINGSFKVFK